MIFRIYPTKNNTIASGFYQNINSGQNSVCDLWFGGGSPLVDSALQKRNSYSRFLVEFDITYLQNKLLNKEINPAFVSSYTLKMKNSIPKDKILEPEYEFDVLNKNIAASFDLICFPINKDWDEGRGYDLSKQFYLVQNLGNPFMSGFSNWNNATLATTWDEPGVYTNPTGATFLNYSGTTTQSGVTFSIIPGITNLTATTFYTFNTISNQFMQNGIVTASTIGNNISVSFADFYSGSTIQTGMTFSVSSQPISTGWTFTTSADTVMSNNTVSAFTVGNNVFVNFSGNLVSTTAWLSAIESTPFSGFGISVVGNSPTTFISSAGTQIFTLSANTVEAKGQYSGTTLAVIRSKRNQITSQFYFTQEKQIQLGNITSTLGTFVISASTGLLTAVTNSGYTVSLDETSDSYILKLLGNDPGITTGTENIFFTEPAQSDFLYVEKIYPHFIREASNRGDIVKINLVPIFSTEDAYTNFQSAYTNAMTPWIVSRVIGGQVKPLFRFQTIADGDTANQDIKITISNIDIINYTFDVIVRNFADTDATAASSAYERWSNLSLNPQSTTYIGKVIGTTDESYPQKSLFVTVDISANADPKSVPAGYMGYTLRGSKISGSTGPNLYYKTDYFSGDSIFKTYLGVSELAYTSLTQTQIGVFSAVKTLEYDLYDYDGAQLTGTVTTKGFHMENIADSTQYASGSKNSLTAYTNPAGTLIDKNQLKFTVAPYGGFDGFDKYRQYSNNYEQFIDAYKDNVAAFKQGIDAMSAPEQVDINLFATPGVDFSNNLTLINYAVDMVETRNDTLYIIESPRITIGTNKGTPEELVSDLQSTGIDSNYAATYWPWLQVLDSSTNLYTYQPPTMMVVRAIAYTDNIAAPWFAPAGLIRGGATSAIIRTDIKLTKNQRDILYQGNVNPIATYVQQGISIWGQKTLQISQSALDRINVRRLLLQVRRLIAAASLTLVFEQNDQTLRDQFLAKVEPILLQIQNQRGLTAFKVVMDNSNNNDDTIDRNELIGKIQLKPTRTAEFIDLTFQVLPTGANFEDF